MRYVRGVRGACQVRRNPDTTATRILPRDPRTVEASRALVSFALHADVQSMCEFRARVACAPVKLACDDADIDAVLATLGVE